MRKKKSFQNMVVIGFVLLLIAAYLVATHPLILIPIIGIPIALVIISLYRKKTRQQQYLNALNAMSINDLDQLEGVAFEHFLKNLFEIDGYKVHLTKASGDMGADLIVEGNGRTCAIQAKRYNGTVGVSAVQEVVSSIRIYGADCGMVITNSEYTTPAIKLAQVNGVELINRSGLENLIVKIYNRNKKKNSYW